MRGITQFNQSLFNQCLFIGDEAFKIINRVLHRTIEPRAQGRQTLINIHTTAGAVGGGNDADFNDR